MSRRRFYKGTKNDPAYENASVNELYERSTLAAFVCGTLISFVAVLFWSYFHDWRFFTALPFMSEALIGMIIVNLAIVFVLAYPARHPSRNIIIMCLIMLPIGYLNYGPYAAMIVGPLEDITGIGFGNLAGQAEESLHCVMILFTNPMAFNTECQLGKQKAPEEKKIPVGVEITRYELYPEGDIYPHQALSIITELENQGDYIAKNVTMVTETSSVDAEYRVCGQEVFSTLISSGTREFNDMRPGEIVYYEPIGVVSDPWKSKNCTYAVNKQKIDAKMSTKYSYNYATESSLPLTIVRSLNETHEKVLESGRVKSAPVSIIMYYSAPFSRKEKALSTKPIYIHMMHEYGSGEITFRGVNKTVTTYFAGGKEYGSLDEVMAAAIGGEISSEKQGSSDKEEPGSEGEEKGEEDSVSEESAECNSYCGAAGYGKGLCVNTCTGISLGEGGGMGCPNEDLKFCCCEAPASSPPTGNLLLAQGDAEPSDSGDAEGEAKKESEGKYSTCLDKDRPSREIKLTEKSCLDAGHIPVYKKEENVERGEGNYDIIYVYPIGEENSKNIGIYCSEADSSNRDAGVQGKWACACQGEKEKRVCNLTYIGSNGEIKLSPKKRTPLLYTLWIDVTGFPEEEEDGVSRVSSITLNLHANATYTVQLPLSKPIFVVNPHY